MSKINVTVRKNASDIIIISLSYSDISVSKGFINEPTRKQFLEVANDFYGTFKKNCNGVAPEDDYINMLLWDDTSFMFGGYDNSKDAEIDDLYSLRLEKLLRGRLYDVII